MGENPHSTVSQEPERVAVRRKLHRNLYTRGSHFLSISPRSWRLNGITINPGVGKRCGPFCFLMRAATLEEITLIVSHKIAVRKSFNDIFCCSFAFVCFQFASQQLVFSVQHMIIGFL